MMHHAATSEYSLTFILHPRIVNRVNQVGLIASRATTTIELANEHELGKPILTIIDYYNLSKAPVGTDTRTYIDAPPVVSIAYLRNKIVPFDRGQQFRFTHSSVLCSSPTNY